MNKRVLSGGSGFVGGEKRPNSGVIRGKEDDELNHRKKSFIIRLSGLAFSLPPFAPSVEYTESFFFRMDP